MPVKGYSKPRMAGSRGQKYLADRFHPGPYYNAELQSVPGEAGNLFFTGGPQSGSQPSLKAFINQPMGEQHGQLFPMLLKLIVSVSARLRQAQSYPSIYIVGWVNNVYGIWQSNNDAQSWTQIGTYPTGSLDQIKTISGDPNIYGQVYVGFTGSGYAYLPAARDRTVAPPTINSFSPDSGTVSDQHHQRDDSDADRHGGC